LSKSEIDCFQGESQTPSRSLIKAMDTFHGKAHSCKNPRGGEGGGIFPGPRDTHSQTAEHICLPSGFTASYSAEPLLFLKTVQGSEALQPLRDWGCSPLNYRGMWFRGRTGGKEAEDLSGRRKMKRTLQSRVLPEEGTQSPCAHCLC
jgi:hypothetical protein